MTLEIDETDLAHRMDGIKSLADSNKSIYNEYPRIYKNYISAYSAIGLYITEVAGKHIVKRSIDL